MSAEHADFPCSACGLTAEHELRYAGRLLEHTRCLNCGHVVELEQRVLLPAYLLDLERRVASKPSRMLKRAHGDRWGFMLGLPAAIARQPWKFAREFWSIVKR